MIHKITFASNPRMLIIFLLAIALPVGGILLTVLFNIFLGVVVTIGGGFIAYHLVKFGISNLRSWIETGDDGITICIANEESQHLAWLDITHAGSVTQPRSRDQVFVYAEVPDKLYTIPNEYSGYNELISNISENLPDVVEFEAVVLEQTQSINDYLKARVAPPTNTKDLPSET